MLAQDMYYKSEQVDLSSFAVFLAEIFDVQSGGLGGLWGAWSQSEVLVRSPCSLIHKTD